MHVAVFSTCCGRPKTQRSEVARLQDLVTPLIAESKLRKESPEDVGILILGDSADRNLAFDTCLSAAREVCTTLNPLPGVLLLRTTAKLSRAMAGGMLVTTSQRLPALFAFLSHPLLLNSLNLAPLRLNLAGSQD